MVGGRARTALGIGGSGSATVRVDAYTVTGVSGGRRHRRGGRVTPRGTRPGSYRLGLPGGWQEPQAEPDLLDEVRSQLATGEPLDLLAQASGLIVVCDERNVDPFARARGAGPDLPSLEVLTGTFAEVDRVETTALLACLAELADEERIRAQARRALADRHHPLPPWLDRLGEATVIDTAEMTHVLGDGENVMVGLELAGGQQLTAVMYIDHNLGTVAKDGFVVDGPVAGLVQHMRSAATDPDFRWASIESAAARARLAEAVETGAITVPRFETETWPACRPLFEWIMRLLPEGGTSYQRPDWDEAARRSLARRFFASPFGAPLKRAASRDLLESVLWFATDYGPGDPLRWSPTAVEILLLDWIPRKIIAESEFLSAAPDLLRAFIRFSHAETGIRPGLTAETLAAVDRFEPEYQQTIRSPRLQGPAALMAAAGFLDLHGGWVDDEDEAAPDIEAILAANRTFSLDLLADAVGGSDVLATLADEPLEDEAFSWDGIREDIRPAVDQVLSQCDSFCDTFLDTEYRTVCRRLLAGAAGGDPDLFRGTISSEALAAGVCWVVGKANELFTSGTGLRVKDVMAHFGVYQAKVTPRAKKMMQAIGVKPDQGYAVIDVGTPRLLVSSRRRRIIDRRDRLTATAK